MLDDALVMQNKTMHEMCDAARAGRQAGSKEELRTTTRVWRKAEREEERDEKDEDEEAMK